MNNRIFRPEKVMQAREAVMRGYYDTSRIVDITASLLMRRLKRDVAKLDEARAKLRSTAGRNSPFWTDCED